MRAKPCRLRRLIMHPMLSRQSSRSVALSPTSRKMLCPSAGRRGPRSAVNSSGRRSHLHRPTTRLLKKAPRCLCRPRMRAAYHPVTLRFSSPERSNQWAALALSISSWKHSPDTSIPGSDYSEAKSDISLAGLFWAGGADEDILIRLVKKTLFAGVFAFLIGNWNSLARIIFESFAGLGLKASGTGLSSADFLKPGKIAQVGLDAGRPILDSISGLMGYVSFFENFIQIALLLFAWIVVLLAFFILAIQLFITLIEFKLTTLAGFVLIPFGLFGKTAFAAERVLGNVISSGVKVLVLAVIVGIGSTLFSQFTAGFSGNQPTIDNAMALVLGALSLLGLGIFGPGIANGIVSGGPQLGAGAAVGTGLAAGGAIVAGAGLAAGGAGLAGGALVGGARGAAAIAG